jgi:hypothetical protein
MGGIITEIGVGVNGVNFSKFRLALRIEIPRRPQLAMKPA